MITIAVVNQKGGVAKTTTAVNLAVGLGMNGKRVLLIDLDPQAHSTLALRVDKDAVLAEKTVASLFYDHPLEDIIVETIEPNLKLVPASIHLATAVENLYSVIFKEVKISKALTKLTLPFDYVILDSGPNLGVLSVNAIVAADRILIPTQLSMYSLDGLNALLNTIDVVKQGAERVEYRIVLTRVKGHGKKRKASALQILSPLADHLLSTQIRETEGIEQSQMSEDEDQVMAVVLNRQSTNLGSQDYHNLVKEIMTLWPA